MSAKKAAEAADNVQTAAARREAEAELRALTTEFAPAHARLLASTRRHLRELLPTAHEVVYEYRDCLVISFAPGEHGMEGVFAIRASADGIVLYLNRGKDLPDPAKVLQGTGKQTRSIKLEGASTLARPEVARLIDEAIARNDVPYAHAGSGSVLIRPTAAKKRRSAKELS